MKRISVLTVIASAAKQSSRAGGTWMGWIASSPAAPRNDASHQKSMVMTILLAFMPLSAFAESPFDGTWDTTLSCANAEGALGYSFEFPATVDKAELYASKGDEGKPGWLEIKGKIDSDGTAMLYASGLVGAHQFAVGGRPAGTQYGYHIKAKFFGDEGTGSRVEGRSCEVKFVRKRD